MSINRIFMKILHVVPSFNIGGMEKIICAFINKSPRDIFHNILPLDGKLKAVRWIQNENVTSVKFDKTANRAEYFRELYSLIKSNKPELIMTYNWGATDAIWLGKLARVKTIIHSEHGFNIDEAKVNNFKRDCLRYFLYRLTDRVIVVSHELQNFMLKKIRLKKGKVVFIPNGVNTKIFCPNSKEKNGIKKKLGISDNNLVIGYVGRLNPIKNFELMLDMFDKCLQKNQNIKLLIVGDGPEKEKIERMCSTKKIQNNVVLIGEKENVLSFLRIMDIFLLTSHREQMPMTVLESMSAGVPVASVKVGELPYIINQYQNGILFEKDESSEEMANQLTAFLARRDVEQLKDNARLKVKKYYNEEKMINKYLELIRSI